MWMVALLALLSLSCAATPEVSHRPGPRDHTIEIFSISSVEATYSPALQGADRILAAERRPGEAIAERVREWSQATGLWGGPLALRIEIQSVRFDQLPETLPDSVSVDFEKSAFGVGVEIFDDADLVHRMDVGTHRKAWRGASNLSETTSDGRFDALVNEIAWQIVYELTPPGYDEEIIRLGYLEDVFPAGVAAGRRGMLTAGQIWLDGGFGVGVNLLVSDDDDDFHCAFTLAKPSWIASWMWGCWVLNFPMPTAWINLAFHSHDLSYEECQQRARKAAER
jgi:hypothetical protein